MHLTIVKGQGDKMLDIKCIFVHDCRKYDKTISDAGPLYGASTFWKNWELLRNLMARRGYCDWLYTRIIGPKANQYRGIIEHIFGNYDCYVAMGFRYHESLKRYHRRTWGEGENNERGIISYCTRRIIVILFSFLPVITKLPHEQILLNMISVWLQFRRYRAITVTSNERSSAP